MPAIDAARARRHGTAAARCLTARDAGVLHVACPLGGSGPIETGRLNLPRSSRYQSSATSSACESSSRFVVAGYCLPPTDAAGWRGHKPTSRWAQPDLSGSAPLFGRVILQASANRAHPIHDFSWPADGPISRAPETSRTHQRPSLPRHHRYSAHSRYARLGARWTMRLACLRLCRRPSCLISSGGQRGLLHVGFP